MFRENITLNMAFLLLVVLKFSCTETSAVLSAKNLILSHAAYCWGRVMWASSEPLHLLLNIRRARQGLFLPSRYTLKPSLQTAKNTNVITQHCLLLLLLTFSLLTIIVITYQEVLCYIILLKYMNFHLNLYVLSVEFYEHKNKNHLVLFSPCTF